MIGCYEISNSIKMQVWLSTRHQKNNQFKRVLGAQKKHLIETVLLSTHNICVG